MKKRFGHIEPGGEHSDILAWMGTESTLPNPSPREVVERLRQAYPLLFTDPPKPLQKGVHKQIRAARPPSLEGVNNTAISKGIGRWVRQEAYLKAIKSRQPRHDLEGRPVADVSDEDVKEAGRLLRQRRYRLRKNRKPPKTTAPPPASEPVAECG